MPSTLPASRRHPRLPSLLVGALLTLLLGSCAGSRLAFRFAPAPAAAVGSPPLQAAAPAPPAAAPPTPLPDPVVPLRLARRNARVMALARHRIIPSSSPNTTRHRTVRPTTHARLYRAAIRTAPRHGTEVGLGTTVLGVLGLVVLPLSLLGLLIWGGPVWAILAVLAAVAILVAYLDPFQ